MRAHFYRTLQVQFYIHLVVTYRVSYVFPWTSASVSPFLYTSPGFIPCTAITFPRAFTPTTPFWPLTSGNTVQTNLNKKATCSSVHVNRNMYKKTMIFVYVIRNLTSIHVSYWCIFKNWMTTCYDDWWRGKSMKRTSLKLDTHTCIILVYIYIVPSV